MSTRRDFLKKTSLGGAALLGLPAISGFSFPAAPAPSALFTLSNSLIQRWGEKLLSLQITDSTNPDYGGILCPTYKIVHGRVGDTIYPFFYLAHKTGDHRYTDASVLLFRWLEQHVSQDDGSWLNEPQKGSWKGTTIFSIIALTEALKHHGTLMDAAFKTALTDRLRKAGEFVYNNFTMTYGNINYPIAASHGLTLLGDVLDIPKYRERGREFAHEALAYITPGDKLIYGEGDISHTKSPKGCLSVDLGYNVEESLPSLVAYGLLTKDEDVLGPVTASLQAHLEFMLPDGGWDNSWGTRNYKWTYWGSRTSDGCQPAYALLSDRDPRFYTAALHNTQLLEQCTHDGLLYGGPHYVSHGVKPSVHHTFCHIKALVAIAGHDTYQAAADRKAALPRANASGVKTFNDIQTWLVAHGKFRATVTACDREYKKTRNGHATGGALTMLWHENAGVMLCASMNEYQLFEAGNMQPDTDPHTMPLTPRLELKSAGSTYMNICDLSAQVTVKARGDTTTIETSARLVDKDQNNPPTGEVRCTVIYTFTSKTIHITFRHTGPATGEVYTIIPVIAAGSDKVTHTDSTLLTIQKPKGTIQLKTSTAITQLPTSGSRVFNFVPGLEAIPLQLAGQQTEVTLSVV